MGSFLLSDLACSRNTYTMSVPTPINSQAPNSESAEFHGREGCSLYEIREFFRAAWNGGVNQLSTSDVKKGNKTWQRYHF